MVSWRSKYLLFRIEGARQTTGFQPQGQQTHVIKRRRQNLGLFVVFFMGAWKCWVENPNGANHNTATPVDKIPL